MHLRIPLRHAMPAAMVMLALFLIWRGVWGPQHCHAGHAGDMDAAAGSCCDTPPPAGTTTEHTRPAM
jgi:hypothetical protein